MAYKSLVLALFASLLLSAFAQNIADIDANVDAFATSNNNIKSYVTTEIIPALQSTGFSLDPPQATQDGYRNFAETDADSALIDWQLKPADANHIPALRTYRDSLQANINSAMAARDAYLATREGNLTDFNNRWVDIRTNMTRERLNSIDMTMPFVSRVRSSLLVHVLAVSQRALAANIYRYKSYGELLELNYRNYLGGVWAINNTLARLSGNNSLDGIPWTPVPDDTVKEDLIQVVIGSQTRGWRMDQCTSVEASQNLIYANATAELARRVEDYNSAVYASIDTVRTNWKNDATWSEKLGQRIMDQLGAITGLSVTFKGLNNNVNISSNTGFTRDRGNNESSVDQARLDVIRHLNVVHLAATGLRESEVSTSANTTSTVKRSGDSWTAVTQLGNSNTPIPSGDVTKPPPTPGATSPNNDAIKSPANALAYSAALLSLIAVPILRLL